MELSEIDKQYLHELSRINKVLSTIENQNDFERGFFPRLTLKEAQKIPLNKLKVLRGKTYARRVGADRTRKSQITNVSSQKEWFEEDLHYRYRNERGKRGTYYAEAEIQNFIDKFRDPYVSNFVEKIIENFRKEHTLRETMSRIESAFSDGIVTDEVLKYKSNHGGEPQSMHMQKFLTDFAYLFEAPSKFYSESMRESML